MASVDAVEQIKNRLSIVDVVSPYVELHQAGKHLKGRCPFHTEKTPSFNVSADRGTYHCFGCGVGGDIFTFIEAIDGVDFKGALKILADKAGVELVPEDPKKRSERDTLFMSLEESTRFFESELKKEKEASDYLKRRGVTDVTRTNWRIGYAPDEWRALASHLKEKNLSEEMLRKAGLAKGEPGKEPYDVFRGRVMFPINDASGRVVGFSGRILAKDSEAPKYVNSPETELFDKSSVLYGYDKAKQAIRTMSFSLIVEGQFDVVMSHQSGYRNTVAVSGTALTSQHVGLLQRLSNRVVLALDGDEAGIKAVKRAAELMLGRGMDVKVASLPDGKDPADLVQNDPASYKQAIGQAKHVVEFLLEYIKVHAKDERAFKLRVRDEVLPFVAHIASHIDREHFEGVVALGTSSTTEAIHLEVERIREIQEKEKSRSEKPTEAETKPVFVLSKDALDRAAALGALVAVSSEVVPKELSVVLERVIKSVTGMSAAAYRDTLPKDMVSPLLFSLEEQYEAFDRKHLAQQLASNIEDWRRLALKSQLNILKQTMSKAEEEGNEDQVNATLQAIQDVHTILRTPPVTAEDLLEAA